MKKVTKIDKIQPSQTSKKKLRVAAYCRVSTDSDAQLESLDAQKEHYKNYITSRDDWTFAGLYFDEGITGTKADKRPITKRPMMRLPTRSSNSENSEKNAPSTLLPGTHRLPASMNCRISSSSNPHTWKPSTRSW